MRKKKGRSVLVRPLLSCCGLLYLVAALVFSGLFICKYVVLLIVVTVGIFAVYTDLPDWVLYCVAFAISSFILANSCPIFDIDMSASEYSVM